jgi:hypothetical protein
MLDIIGKNNNAKVSFIYVLEMYKTINTNIDDNGMLMLGIKYDKETSYKFKTIGIRGKYGVNGSQYGIFLWSEALQYDQDDDDNTTITSLIATDKVFIPYNYAIPNLTIMTTFEYDSDSDTLSIEHKTVNKDMDGNRLLNIEHTLDCSDDGASFEPGSIDEYITMPELNQNVEYSIYHIKTFGDKLTLNELEYQSNILITL